MNNYMPNNKKVLQKILEDRRVYLFSSVMVFSVFAISMFWAFYKIGLDPYNFLYARMLLWNSAHAISIIIVSSFGIWTLFKYGWVKSLAYTFFLFVSHEAIWSYIYTIFSGLWTWAIGHSITILSFTLTFIIFCFWLYKVKKINLFLRSISAWLIITYIYFLIYGARVSIHPIYKNWYLFFDPLTNTYEILSVLIYVLSFAIFVKMINKGVKNAKY